MHTRDARKQGVSDAEARRPGGVGGGGRLFTERERAALALTDAITELGDGGVSDDVYRGRPRCSPIANSVR